MHRILLWILAIAFGSAVLGFSIQALLKMKDYYRLDERRPIESIQWSILSLSDEKYIPVAKYSFIINGKIYEGQTQSRESYLNEWTAQEAIERQKVLPPRMVWYDSSYPQFSSLRKDFPTKQMVYAGLLWLLTFYFVSLGCYVKGKI